MAWNPALDSEFKKIDKNKRLGVADESTALFAEVKRLTTRIEELEERLALQELWLTNMCEALIGPMDSIIVQDIEYTAAKYSARISIELTAGATAGSEVVTVVKNAIACQIESGVSTANQVITAIEDKAEAAVLVNLRVAEGGTGSNVQVTAAAADLLGGYGSFSQPVHPRTQY